MSVWLGFGALCLLSGSAWLFDEAMTQPLSGLARIAVHQGVLALVFWLASLAVEQGVTGIKGITAGWEQATTSTFVAAAFVFAVPEVVLTLASGKVSQLTEALIFLVVPVAVVVAGAQRSARFGKDDDPLRQIFPAIAGIFGASLLLPFSWPRSGEGRAWVVALAASAVGAGIAAVSLHGMLVRCHREGSDGELKGLQRRAGRLRVECVRVLRSASIVALTMSALCGFAAWGDGVVVGEVTAVSLGHEGVRCFLIDGPIVLLNVWLLGAMRPVRFSARMLLVPLVAIAESYLITRPSTTWVTGAGMLLMLGGGGGLLRGEDSAEML